MSNVDTSKFDMRQFGDNIVTWADLIKKSSGHENAHAIFYLPVPVKQNDKEFNAMCMVKLKTGGFASILMRFDVLDDRPEYCIPEHIMTQFV